MDKNKLTVIGTVVENFTKGYETHGESFYKGKISIKRQSGIVDILSVVVSQYMIDTDMNYVGKVLSIEGEFRSKNITSGDKSHLILFIFPKKVEIADIPIELNSIELTGTICREPEYRETPLGREICDFMIAVNRPYGKSSYIPCISWGRNALKANTFEVGDKVKIMARIQSREYQKKHDDGSCETRIVYEVSCSSVVKGEAE